MDERLVLPEELDAIAPGPGLAALLDTVDLERVNGYDAVRLACAAARQVAHDQSRLLACVATVARCAAGGPAAPVVRLPQPDLDSAVDEVGFALHLTPSTPSTSDAVAGVAPGPGCRLVPADGGLSGGRGSGADHDLKPWARGRSRHQRPPTVHGEAGHRRC